MAKLTIEIPSFVATTAHAGPADNRIPAWANEPKTNGATTVDKLVVRFQAANTVKSPRLGFLWEAVATAAQRDLMEKFRPTGQSSAAQLTLDEIQALRDLAGQIERTDHGSRLQTLADLVTDAVMVGRTQEWRDAKVGREA